MEWKIPRGKKEVYEVLEREIWVEHDLGGNAYLRKMQ